MPPRQAVLIPPRYHSSHYFSADLLLLIKQDFLSANLFCSFHLSDTYSSIERFKDHLVKGQAGFAG